MSARQRALQQRLAKRLRTWQTRTGERLLSSGWNRLTSGTKASAA